MGLRAAPGLVNLLSILLLARKLSLEDYGIYSVLSATGLFVSSVVFGMLFFPVVAHYARYERSGRGELYVGTNIGLYLLFALGCCVIGGIASTTLELPFAPVAMAVILGLHSLLQEFTRAALRIVFFAFSDLLQAGAFLALVAFWITPETPPAAVVYLLALSYAVASASNLVIFFDKLRPRLDFGVVREVLHTGAWLVVNNITENILTLGTRYVLLGMDQKAALGALSFAIDLAQRTIGFMVNIMSFLFVPRAFLAEHDGGGGSFRQEILRGAVAAVAFGCAGMLFMAVFIQIPNPLIDRAVLHAPVFFIAATAVVITRLRKLIVDPFAVRRNRTRNVVAANIAGGCLGVALTYWWGGLGGGIGAATGYFVGWLVIFAIGCWCFRHELAGRPVPDEGAGKRTRR